MMRQCDAPGNQAGTRAPCAAAPTPGPRGANEAVESLRDQLGAPLEALSGSGRTQPAFPPLTNPKTHNHKTNPAEKASHKIDSQNST